MTFDRLERCNLGAWSYRDQYYLGLNDERLYDPPRDHYLPTRIKNAQARKADGSQKRSEEH